MKPLAMVETKEAIQLQKRSQLQESRACAAHACVQVLLEASFVSIVPPVSVVSFSVVFSYLQLTAV